MGPAAEKNQKLTVRCFIVVFATPKLYLRLPASIVSQSAEDPLIKTAPFREEAFYDPVITPFQGVLACFCVGTLGSYAQ